MQGQGISHHYLGIACPLKKARIALVPIAFDETATYMRGAANGPRALIEASRNLELYDIETASEVADQGIFTAPLIEEQTSEKMLKAGEERVKEYLDLGKFVVTLGGEHSISYGPIRAHSRHFSPLTVLQLDAHTDLVEAYENNPYSHASVMARVKKLEGVCSTVCVGVRSMAKEEMGALKGTSVFFADKLRGNWVEEVVAHLTDRVYITLDLDVLDPAIMPSTGTPEPGGLDWQALLALLKKVIETKVVVGLDIVELCPISGLWAPDFLAAKLLYKILSYRFFQQK